MFSLAKSLKQYRERINFNVIEFSPETFNFNYSTVSVSFRRLSSAHVCWFVSLQRDCPLCAATCLHLALLHIITQFLCCSNIVVKVTVNVNEK
jgi:hypothetical protein